MTHLQNVESVSGTNQATNGTVVVTTTFGVVVEGKLVEKKDPRATTTTIKTLIKTAMREAATIRSIRNAREDFYASQPYLN